MSALAPSLNHSPSVTKKVGDGTGSSVFAALPKELYTCMKLSKNKLSKNYRQRQTFGVYPEMPSHKNKHLPYK